MINPPFFYPKNSLNLYGLDDNFKFLSCLYKNKNLPKVIMFTGSKGIGKSTLINHFLFSIFDEKNYDKEYLRLSETSNFYNQFKNDIFSNIIYFKGYDFKSIKVDDIRNLKTKIFQSSILNKERFIVLDDIELFNKNSLNALLKIIEEPSKRNYFFLINNKSKPLIDTIKSRALEIKIILNETTRIQIINNLINLNNIEPDLNPESSQLTPGNFIKFDHICKVNKILPSGDFIDNLSSLLNLYRKNKDILFINLATFLTDCYFKDLKFGKILKNIDIYDTKKFVLENINNFLLYNINQNTLINAVNCKLNNE
tara:strand:- start:420 stop:1355 length:936 start_codon:yes stop_codon:yes gene_type:complete